MTANTDMDGPEYASPSELTPVEARSFALDHAIAADFRAGAAESAMARAPEAFALLQQICASSISRALADAFREAFSDVRRAVNDLFFANAREGDDLEAAGRALSLVPQSQAIEMDEAVARDCGFRSDPPDTPFTGIDDSPVPPVPFPLPDVPADSPWARFDANGYIQNVVSVAQRLGRLVPSAFESIEKPSRLLPVPI